MYSNRTATTLPTWEIIALPLLTFASDRREHTLREAIEHLASHFSLTPDQRKELLPSGKQPRFDNRVGWTKTALEKAGLLKATRTAHFEITTDGLAALAEPPAKMGREFLMRYPGYREFRGQPPKPPPGSHTASPNGEMPEAKPPKERLEEAFEELNNALAGDVLARIKSCSPQFFEQLVVDLLVKMGYGGSRADAGRAIGRSGDGGVDGVIKEDELGLDMIYVQAKRYTQASVPAADVRDFVGALVGKRARKGVFLTTSQFQTDARRYAETIEGKTLVLIDGEQLAQLMIKYELGVSMPDVYKVGRLDDDYFEGA